MPLHLGATALVASLVLHAGTAGAAPGVSRPAGRTGRSALAGTGVGAAATETSPAGGASSGRSSSAGPPVPGGLQAEAEQLAAAVAADAARLQRLATRYLVEDTTRRTDQLRLRATRRRAAAAERATVRARSVLRAVAIADYVGAAGGAPLDVLNTSLDRLTSGEAYASAASDQVSAAIAGLLRAEARRRRLMLAERRALSRATESLAQTAVTRSLALVALRSEQQVLDSVRGHLAQLVAAETAARQRAEAAARSRAIAAEAAALARSEAAGAARRRAAAVALAESQARARALTAARAASARDLAAIRAHALRASAAQKRALQLSIARAAAALAPPRASVHHRAPAAPAAPVAGPPTPQGIVSVSTSPIPRTLGGDFARLRQCESSDVYSLDTGNGYYGAYQFSESTWLGLGETGLPSAAAPPLQDAAAYRLYEQSGWSPWPECAAILGL